MNSGKHLMNGGGGVLLDPLAPINGAAMTEFQLECHNVSYIRSFTTGRWYSKLFNPPITAQFLKDVNMEVHAGEVMGIIGSSGIDIPVSLVNSNRQWQNNTSKCNCAARTGHNCRSNIAQSETNE
jgi:hypothetical protein